MLIDQLSNTYCRKLKVDMICIDAEDYCYFVEVFSKIIISVLPNFISDKN